MASSNAGGLTLQVQTPDGKKSGTVDLPAELFDVEPNIALMHQVVTAQLAAARQGTHSTKTRGEVRGGALLCHGLTIGTSQTARGTGNNHDFIGKLHALIRSCFRRTSVARICAGHAVMAGEVLGLLRLWQPAVDAEP